MNRHGKRAVWFISAWLITWLPIFLLVGNVNLNRWLAGVIERFGPGIWSSFFLMALFGGLVALATSFALSIASFRARNKAIDSLPLILVALVTGVSAINFQNIVSSVITSNT